MTTDWLTLLKCAKKSCILDGNLKKIHYDLSDGRELVEEYNTDTNVVTRRAWKCKNTLKEEPDWNIEIGDPEPLLNKAENLIIKENAAQPIVSRRVTKKNLEWRIRNLPYPLNTYSVLIDSEENCIVVRTTNKKYFKKLNAPDLDRLNLKLIQENISFSHKFNTLIITYKKPIELIQFENALLEELKNVKPKNAEDLIGGSNCNPS